MQRRTETLHLVNPGKEHDNGLNNATGAMANIGTIAGRAYI